MSDGAVVLACACLCLVAAAGIARPWLSGSAVASVPAAAERAAEGTPRRTRRRLVPIGVGLLALVVTAAPFVVTAVRPAAVAAERDAPAVPVRVAALEHQVAARPSAVNPRLALALAYLAIGDVSSAAETYAEVLHLDPANVRAHAQLGMILLEAGRPGLALREENRALASQPDDPGALLDKGLVLLHGLHDRERASHVLRKYLRVVPSGAGRTKARSLLRSLRRDEAHG